MVKLLRGKRSLRLTTADWAMLILALLIFTNCVVNRSDIGYACMSILFCLVAVTGSHLLRSHGVAFRFQRSLMISSLITVLAVTADVAILYVPKWVLRDIPVSVFFDRVLNNFGTRDHAGLYLFLIFPFVMSAFYLSKKMRAKFCYFVYALLIFGCFVLTESRTVMIVGVLLVAMYLLMRNPRHLLTILFFGTLGVLAFVFLLPRNYTQVFINYFSDSGNRIMEGLSEFKHIFLDSATRYYTGLGFGQVQGSNLYTMALSSLGMIGFLTLVLAILLLIGYATVSTIRNRSASPRLQPIMSACYTAVFGVLFIGARLPVFNSAGVLLMFCLIYGFTMGIGRTMRKSAVLLEAATDHDVEFSPIFMQGGDLSE